MKREENRNLHKDLLKRALAEPMPFPEGRFSGDGIVICGGGTVYFSCAWVCIRMLRTLGCTLPVQLWHLGDAEMDARMRALIEPFGVTEKPRRGRSSLLHFFTSPCLLGEDWKRTSMSRAKVFRDPLQRRYRLPPELPRNFDFCRMPLALTPKPILGPSGLLQPFRDNSMSPLLHAFRMFTPRLTPLASFPN